MYDARQIANWFVERAECDGEQLTIMQLLKLIYIAHGWHLEMSLSPLISNKIEAWKYGPVIPDVYNAFRKKGISVTETVDGFDPVADAYVESLLEYVHNNYGKLPALRLSEITHERGGPWEQITKRYGYYAPIPNKIMLSHWKCKRRSFNQQNIIQTHTN